MKLQDRVKLKKFINELKQIKGRHTELVSVFIPKDYDLNKINQHLAEEQSTAQNIKDARTRKNVIDSLERCIRHLRLYKKTPENGLALFAGNASENESKIDIKVWSLEPPEPLNFRLYRCDQTFLLDPLIEMLETKEIFGLIVLDRREGDVGTLKGTRIESIVHMTSGVPGKTKAGGQCVMPDTLIQSSEGDIFEIIKAHNPHVLVGSSIENYSIKNTAIIDKWNAKKDKVYKIITKYPRIEVECSKDHVFFVKEDEIVEKSAEELKAGDLLIMPEKINVESKEIHFNPLKYYNSFTLNKDGCFLIKSIRIKNNLYQKQLASEIGVTQTAISTLELGKRDVRALMLNRLCNRLNLDFNKFLELYTTKKQDIILPDKLDKNLAQILGYFLGDGNFEDERLAFSEENKELAEKYVRILSSYFNANVNLKYRENKGYWQIRVYGKPLVRFFNKEFPELRSLNYSIPKKIMESSNDVVASFLKGLFDAEGYSNESRGVALGMNNKKIIQQIQMLFLRFGIISSLHEYDNNKNPYSDKHRFIIDLTEKKSLELFKNLIGFTFSKKMHKLEIILENKSARSNVRQILISGKKIREMIEQAGYNLELFPKVNSFFRDERMMSKGAFNSSILEIVKKKDKKLYEELKKIYEIPILPVKIAKIEEKCSETNMVDISTQQGNFIANGLIVHNSAARFERLREGAAKEFYRRIGEAANKAFLEMKDLKGVLVGGPGPTKEEFLEGGHLNEQLKRKVVAVEDLGYTGDFGLQELVDKSQEALANLEISEEKAILKEFFTLLGKNENMVSYGDKVDYALEMGAVDKLLLSENLKEEEIERYEEKALNYGTTIVIISINTREGEQLKTIGGKAALLRYPI